MDTNKWAGRHPSVAHFGPLFAWAHLPEHLAAVSKPFADLAGEMLDRLTDSPELAAGMRKLLEAKDCFVRQAVLDWAPVPGSAIPGTAGPRGWPVTYGA